MLKVLIVPLVLIGCAVGQESAPNYSGAYTVTDHSYVTATQSISIGKGPMVKIDLETASVTFGKDYKIDGASEIFWKSLSGDSPTALKRRIAELEAELAKSKCRTAKESSTEGAAQREK